MAEIQEGGHRGDIRPIPDPTALTSEANARLEGMIRNLIKTEIQHQHDLFDEKLSGAFKQIITQLTMLDARTAEQKQDTTNALNAALAAQKEAVAAQTASSEKSITKSETATIERIKAVETLLSASTRASDDKIDDLKSRIVAIEAVKLGSAEGAAAIRQGGTDTRAILTSIIGIILVLIAMASIAIAILKP
jgi:hypothetical protein